MCPTIAAMPAAAGTTVLVVKRSASHTLAAPLVISSSATRIPAVTPEARITLAAPRLPLPTRRRSATRHRRASSSANGTEPTRYAETITRNIVGDWGARGLGAYGVTARCYQLGRRSVGLSPHVPLSLGP